VRSAAIALVGALTLAVTLASGRGVLAQEGTPAAGSRTISCSAAATEAAVPAEEMATAGAGEATAAASPAAELVGTPAPGEPTTAMTRTVRTIATCVNAGDFEGAAALMTDNFIQNVAGAASAADLASALAGVERMRIRLLSSPEVYDDGTASTVVSYEGFLNRTGAVVAERWFFVVDGGVYKVDRLEPAELPPGIA
jgi:hypothetical protein